MRFILDCSVAISWCLVDENNSKIMSSSSQQSLA
ncbi:hypothetical protein PCC9214_04068 [Planktothrix tepida]|uniref:Uncharacterized protein n=1 Tax=Planktothrix pseudagardhii TaxID=132604 RepID=A0A9W4CHL8_9CYAN|nr:hypothetical protein NO713_01566 [Planktothrix pseudagardhii]CAD5974686.1 hypothetical protein PCC9214_04068 [Planktothrix tepida]